MYCRLLRRFELNMAYSSLCGQITNVAAAMVTPTLRSAMISLESVPLPDRNSCFEAHGELNTFKIGRVCL